MSGVDIHAQMTAELIDGSRSYAELPPKGVRLYAAVLALIGILAGARSRWRLASLGLIAFDLLVFRYIHLILPFTLAAVAWIDGVIAGSQIKNVVAWARSQSAKRVLPTDDYTLPVFSPRRESQ